MAEWLLPYNAQWRAMIGPDVHGGGRRELARLWDGYVVAFDFMVHAPDRKSRDAYASDTFGFGWQHTLDPGNAYNLADVQQS